MSRLYPSTKGTEERVSQMCEIGSSGRDCDEKFSQLKSLLWRARGLDAPILIATAEFAIIASMVSSKDAPGGTFVHISSHSERKLNDDLDQWKNSHSL